MLHHLNNWFDGKACTDFLVDSCTKLCDTNEICQKQPQDNQKRYQTTVKHRNQKCNKNYQTVCHKIHKTYDKRSPAACN